MSKRPAKKTARSKPTKPAPTTKPASIDWLPPFLHYVAWTEFQFLSILCDLDPKGHIVTLEESRSPAFRELTTQEALRRARAKQHVDEAIDRELTVRHKPLGEYSVTLADGIRWFLSRRALFPDCRLTKEDLAIVQPTTTAPPGSGEPTTSEAIPHPDETGAELEPSMPPPPAHLQRLAEWAQDQVEKRHLNFTTLARNHGPCRRTVQKIFRGEHVSATSLDKFLRHLGEPKVTRADVVDVMRGGKLGISGSEK